MLAKEEPKVLEKTETGFAKRVGLQTMGVSRSAKVNNRYRKWKSENIVRKKAERKSLKRKGRKKTGKYLSRIARKPSEFFTVKAPKNFSLVENPEEVIAYFKENKKILDDRRQVNFDLSKIDNLSPDAIAFLIANVKDGEYCHGIKVRGNSPKKEHLKAMFDESGFLEHVKHSYYVEKKEGNLLLHQITNNKVENELAKKVGEITVKHTFNTGEKYKPIYEIMIECMANTNNHAGRKEGEYDWWVMVYCEAETKISRVAFLDLGSGIFNSVPVQLWKRALLIKLKETSGFDVVPSFNLDILKDLFEGKISSKTRQKERGQGLPLIFNRSRDKQIRNFTIISNDVYVKIPSLESNTLINRFPGTLLYWEIHPRG